MRKLINRAFRWYHRQRYRNIVHFMEHPHEVQLALWKQLLEATRHTEWGRRFDYRTIRNPATFAERIPVQSYDDLKPYIERMMHGEKDVLWGGQVRWFSKSSGTTSDKSKFIPVSTQNLKECHIKGSWDTMTLFYHNRPDARQFELKSMIMGGSLERFEPHPKTMIGDVSAVMMQHMPLVGRPFFLPDVKTALIADWEEKLELLAQAGAREPNVVMIGGVPTWTLVLFRRILEITGKEHILEVWPHFQVYIHGGVSFTPYRKQFESFFPSESVSYQEIYNASEGYFAVQNDFSADDMLLLLQNGIYYEFLPMEEWRREFPRAIPLWEVQPGKNYALVISTNSGLWRYTPGDTVQFTSVKPYKIRITGRTKQFVNAFGEEVIVENTDRALAETCRELDAIVSEYTVAPIYFKNQDKGGHEWLVEFTKAPTDLEHFTTLLDKNLQKVNSDYEAKRYRSMALERLRLRTLPSGTFHNWLRSKGKIGGQHKVPRLSNDREYIEEILEFIGLGV
ncbi:MAG TPA: GH3 auxin-responsive promoter family protein [Saprospiraceae bacterium]|nr:GH3 auxin-responsive promoter family protein [Saprospiraceae bacterium]HMP22629.1 GH3 auxin-responsive promoter family protein [Saprospiraceae bacterium]